MGPFGHFAIGLLCGTIIMLPFLRDRSLYDYDKQKWVSIEWIQYTKTEITPSSRKLITSDNVKNDSITNELNPITKSKFILYTPIIAVICGFFAMLPDISHLWGNSSLDQSHWADFCFFHYTLDHLYINNQFVITNGALTETFIVFTSVVFMVSLMAISQNYQYNRKNYENVVV
ncbi:MAG: hypothetical protein JSV49_10605 [Thermoplasmata archaeon]|nr:MAG: hypothetical protein JSV49_10605 [Thermoplasmata archaeon]